MKKVLNFWRKSSRKKILRALQSPICCLGIVTFCFFLLAKYNPVVEQDLLFASLSNLEQANEQKVFLDQKEIAAIEFSQSVVGENSFLQTGPASVIKPEVLGSLGIDLAQGGLSERKEIFEYIVEQGDTLFSVAEKFDISLETVLWANNLTSRSKINIGEELIILPTTGIMHIVEKGENLSYLAKLYRADMDNIVDFNNLSDNGDIYIGDFLIIPDAVMPARKPAPSYTPLASAYFIKPVPADLGISQGLHWYNAIDFSNGNCWEPVFASAGGTIQRTGFHSTAGNYVRILHPNEVVTFYGHLAVISTYSGQKVSQGEIIGYVGNTGYTVGPSGCHLHFEVRGARNPFGY